MDEEEKNTLKEFKSFFKSDYKQVAESIVLDYDEETQKMLKKEKEEDNIIF